MGDTGDCPTFGEAIGGEVLVEGQLIFIADDQVVFYVEGRDGVAESGVDGIDFFADVGGLVEGLAVGVGGGDFEASTGVPGAEFECVVVGVADGGLVGVAAEGGSERAAGSVDLTACDGEIGGVFAAGSAGGGAGHDLAGLAEAQAEGWVADVGFDENALAMAGVADVGCGEDCIRTGLALDGEHPLLGVGRFVVDVVAGDALDGEEVAPVKAGVGVVARGVQWGEGVGEWLAVVSSVLGTDEGGCEERFFGAGIGGAVGGVGCEDSDRKRVDGGVKGAEAGADAGGSRAAEEPGEMAACVGLRRPGQAYARGEAAIADGREGVGDSGVAGVEDACGCSGKDYGLGTGDEGGDLVVFFGPGCDAVPAEAVVEGEIGECAPAILCEEAYIFIACVEGIELALVVLAGDTDEEVGKVDAGFLPGEDEAAVELGDGVGVDLVGVKLSTELEGVAAENPGVGVRDLIGVVGLDELVGCCSGGVAVEVEVFDSFACRVEGDDAAGAVCVDESLGDEADAFSAYGLAEVGEVAGVADVEFIDGGRAEALGVGEGDQLGAAGGESVEAGDAGSALGYGVGIVEGEVVNEVIGREQAGAGVCIDTDGSLVIAHGLVEGRCCETIAGVGRGDVLQHALGGKRPCVLRNDGIWEDAIGRGCAV